MKLKNFILLLLTPLGLSTYAQANVELDQQYQPDTYTKYGLELKEEKINFIIFKVKRDEPHLNPLYFDVYFQCRDHKSFYKLKRNFDTYESELSYCANKKPLIQKIKNKKYLILPFNLAEPETGCPATPNRKEVFSVQQVKEHCDTVSSGPIDK